MDESAQIYARGPQVEPEVCHQPAGRRSGGLLVRTAALPRSQRHVEQCCDWILDPTHVQVGGCDQHFIEVEQEQTMRQGQAC